MNSFWYLFFHLQLISEYSELSQNLVFLHFNYILHTTHIFCLCICHLLSLTFCLEITKADKIKFSASLWSGASYLKSLDLILSSVKLPQSYGSVRWIGKIK